MIDQTSGNRRIEWLWVGILVIVIAIGVIAYLRQLQEGLGITGMNQNVTWGLYIAQFTFLVGIAASAVMLILPYYLHDYKLFGRITLLGEFLAVAAVLMSVTFIIVDLGRPDRAFNVILHASPSSILFWDMIVLTGYLLLNLVIGWTVLEGERKGVPPPGWVKPLIYLSIPWAISIHTVTAFIYAGLPGRSFWLTAIMAPRFLASAFASGPALLVLVCLVLRRYTVFDAGREPLQTLGKIIAYALAASIFFVLMELFTAFYSGIPSLAHHFEYMFVGIEGHATLVPWMWTSAVLAVAALAVLLIPRLRRNEAWLAAACAAVFVSLWIEKGLGLVVTGFIPSPTGEIGTYIPTALEIAITLGVWAGGLLILTLLYRLFVAVKALTEPVAVKGAGEP
ncbi:MAG: menaquinol oxidoreductase [Deltaproteobacteria bacterium HGW-Deltaproteobacteria-19]|jgi:molybdopterin-containing oxidoreductase family membrane subunit|nr:MAG: menaquinol oxidoreductase [Deltaproteobacteria bacterium HGW-Deltaproteobacteria-19]